MPQAQRKLLSVHPTFFEGVGEHYSPMQKLVLMLKQDDPDLCDLDCLELIALAHREYKWGGPRAA